MGPANETRGGEVTLSVGQRRLLMLLSEGHKLLILRSPIDGRIVGATLWEPDRNTVVESIPLWRVEKLVALGRLRQNMQPGSPSVEWIVSPQQSRRSADYSQAAPGGQDAIHAI